MLRPDERPPVRFVDSSAGTLDELRGRYPHLQDVLSWCERNADSWQSDFFRDAGLTTIDPVSANPVVLDRPIVGSWNTLFLTRPEIKFSIVATCLGRGFPIHGVLLHELGIYVYREHHIYAVTETELTRFLFEHNEGLALVPDIRSGVSIVLGEINFAHFAHNEIAGLMKVLGLANRAVPIRELCLMREPLGPLADVFPELAELPVRRLRPDALAELGTRENLILIGGTQLSAQGRLAVIKYLDSAHAPTPPTLREAVLASPRPRLMLGIRSHSRVVGNVEETYIAIATRMKKQYGDISVVIDGFSLPSDYAVNPNYDRWFDGIASKSLDRTKEILGSLNQADIHHVFTTADQTVPVALWLSRQCDFYFTNLGTQQHKAGWFSEARGVVHGSPADLTSAAVHWFMHLVDGQKPFDTLPHDLYIEDRGDSHGGAPYRFVDPDQVARWVVGHFARRSSDSY